MAPTSQLLAGRFTKAHSTSSDCGSSDDEPVGRDEVRPRPLQVTWEMTRAGGCKAVPARAAKATARDLQQFSTAEAFHLIEEVANMHVPLLAITGGDPLTRPDLFPLLEFASGRSVRTSLTLFPTPNL